MAHTIEPAKSARANCKTCRKKIEKGELRLGEEAPNPFIEGEMGYRWHHLKCGAKAKSAVLLEALELVEIEVPEKEELLKIIEKSETTEKPARSPYAEYAKTGRSSCIECKETIEKGELRINVYVEPEIEGGFGRKGFVHPSCSAQYSNGDINELMKEIKANSSNLEVDDIKKLEKMLVG